MKTYLPIILLCLLGVSTAEGRKWTDKTGQEQVDADFADLNDGRVILRLPDGTTFPIPLGEFSKADREFVHKEIERRRAVVRAKVKTGPGTIKYGKAKKLCELAADAIDESSGLAASRNRPGLFWTHNDSGHFARLHAFDRQGKDLGSCEIQGAYAYDFEDMASFTRDGKNYLLVGDTGNNGLSSAVQILHLVEEPPLDPARGVTVKKVPQVQTIHYGYEDDYRNCEGLAVDPTTNTILLASKEREPLCRIYALPWPKNDPKKVSSAKLIATVTIPPATGMDISSDGRRAVIVTYSHAYEFTRRKGEDWKAAFKRLPAEIKLPERRQGESICYGPDGKTLYLTSEKRPTPLWEVPVATQ